jgi:hypothetical protein
MSTVTIKGASRPTSFGQQIGAIEVNTQQHGDVSGVKTINLLPYPPVGAGGDLPAGTTTSSTLRYNGSAWVENSTFTTNAGALNGVTSIDSIPWPPCFSDDLNITASDMLSAAGLTFGASAYSAATLVRRFSSGGVVRATVQATFSMPLIGPGAYAVTFDITNSYLAMAGISSSWTTCTGTCTVYCTSASVNPFGSGIIQFASGTTASGLFTVSVNGPIIGVETFAMVIELTARV